MVRLLLLILLFADVSAIAQSPRKLSQDTAFQLVVKEQSTILLPGNYDSTKKYPLLIFLPFTGGTASDYVMMLASNPDDLTNYLYSSTEHAQKSFIILCPGDAGSVTDHSWKGFEACISRYEKRIIEDMASLKTKYGIDTNNVVLCGYSLGGDLSWTISQRYPEKFKGAVISGSRCSYSEKGMMARQAKKGFKYYFAMGKQESADRVNGMNNSIKLLNQAGVSYKNVQIDGEHAGFDIDHLKEALKYILYH